MSEFNNKKKALFESLDAVEKNLNRTNVEQYDEDFGRRRNERQRNDRYVDKYKNKASMFKRPDLPINKCLPARRRPDYEKNPDRYQHYSLSDVTDMSDRMNSSAAFNFLREMEDRRIGEQEQDPSSSESSKIVFKNSKKLAPKKDPEQSADPVQLKGNKFVMPEYVIGEKRQKSSRSSPSSATKLNKSKQLKLSHLADEQEEDE